MITFVAVFFFCYAGGAFAQEPAAFESNSTQSSAQDSVQKMVSDEGSEVNSNALKSNVEPASSIDESINTSPAIDAHEKVKSKASTDVMKKPVASKPAMVDQSPQGSANALTLGPVQLQFEPQSKRSGGLMASGPMQIMLALTALSLLPAVLIAMTAFTRIIIVLAMVRHALGMPETPPNAVLLALAMFLTIFTMVPVIDGVAQKAYTPYMQQQMPLQNAVDAGLLEMKTFMLRQTRMEDLSLMFELSKRQVPPKDEDISMVQLVPAFMLSELRAAFQIGFVIFLPFLLIDLVVASALMALGMMMVPPITISLPLKILLFILIDGWTLLVRALLGSFN